MTILSVLILGNIVATTLPDAATCGSMAQWLSDLFGAQNVSCDAPVTPAQPLQTWFDENGNQIGQVLSDGSVTH